MVVQFECFPAFELYNRLRDRYETEKSSEEIYCSVSEHVPKFATSFKIYERQNLPCVPKVPQIQIQHNI